MAQRAEISLVLFPIWRIFCKCACRSAVGFYLLAMTIRTTLPPHHISDIIQMALSDHVSFDDIAREYGLREKDVKDLMRTNLKPGSYRAWRKRVRTFGDRRATYK